MLLAVHSFRFSGIFYPRPIAGVLAEEERQTGMECCARRAYGEVQVGKLWNKTNHIIPFPTLAVIASKDS